jgi:translation initiation factor IF-2
MTDTKNQGDKTLHVSSKTLSLKRPVEQGVVRQSFSHGRSKSVVVETVKRRPAVGPTGGKEDRPAQQQAAAPAAAPKPAAAAPAPKPAAPAQGARPQRSAPNTPRSGGMVLQTLSEQERDARMNALVDSRRRDEEDRKRQAEEAARRSEREIAEAQEREAAEARKREEEDRRRQDEERKRLVRHPHRLRPGVDLPRAPMLRVPTGRARTALALPAVSTVRVPPVRARTVPARVVSVAHAAVAAPWVAVRRA